MLHLQRIFIGLVCGAVGLARELGQSIGNKEYAFPWRQLFGDPDLSLRDQIRELILGREVAKLLVQLGKIADGQRVHRVNGIVLVNEHTFLI